MIRKIWPALVLGLGFSTSAAYAADASSGSAGPACIGDDAQKTLTTCPDGVKQFTPKDTKPAGVKLGTAAPEEKAKKDNKPPPPSAEMQASQRDLRRAQYAGKAAKLLISEISQLEQLWKATSKSAADRPQITRRLAETYVELENSAFREKTEAEIKKDDAAAGKSKKTLEFARQNAIRYYRVITEEYKNYPQLDEVLYYLAYEYEQANDLDNARKVYFQLINDTPQSKYIPNAYLAFGELFFNEAQGDPSKYELARQSYAKVLEYPPATNSVWGYAQYKIGYVYWNLGDTQSLAKAVDAFKKTIDYSKQYASKPGVKALGNSARKDIVPVYALVGKPDGAYAFFKPLTEDGADRSTYDMMDQLGLNYLDTGHYAEAVVLYTDLLNRDKGDKSCEYQVHIVQATMAMKGGAAKQNVRATMDDLIKKYKQFKAENHSDASKVTCAGDTADLLYETGAAWQIEAQGSGGVRGTGDKNTMKLAAELYNLITSNFTKDEFSKFEFPKIVKEDWPTLFKIKYAKADLLYFEGDWEKCGPAFDEVVDEDPTSPEAAEAAYAAVLCYQKRYEATHNKEAERKGTGNMPKLQEKKDEKAAAKDALKKKDLTAEQKGMIGAFSRYLCVIKPSDGDSKAKDQYTEVKYARARIYFEAHWWEEAAAAFKDIAMNNSDSDSGIYAAQLYLEALNILGTNADPPRPSCYSEMGDSVPKFIELYCTGGKDSKNPDQCSQLQKIQVDIKQLKVQKLKEAGDRGGPDSLRLREQAATGYLGLWKEYCEGPIQGGKKPDVDRCDEIIWNAAESFQSARLIMKSIQARLILLDPKYGFEKGTLAQKSVYKIGGNYQAIAVYEEAAKWYEKYAKEFPKAEKADQALSDAVVLRLGLGQEAEGIKDADDFQKSYGGKKPVEAAQVAFAIGAHYVEREDWDNARKRLQGAMSLIDKNATLDVQAQAHALLGRVYIKIKSPQNADPEYKKVQGLWKDPKAAADKILQGDPDANTRKLAKALTAVGESYFYFAEKEKKKVDAIKFPEYKGPSDRTQILKHVATKVKDWIQKKKPAIEAAEKEYLKIVQLEPAPPPNWVIAAGARVGGMWGNFVREFRAAPIPNEWKGHGPVPGIPDLTYDDIRNEYYSKLDEASEPLKQRAKGAFETCLNYSVKYQYFDEYSRSCEEWLSKTYKNEYHLVDEFRGAPNRVNSGLSDKPYPLDIEGKPVNPNAPAADDKDQNKPEDAGKSDDKSNAADNKKGQKGGKKQPAGGKKKK